MLWALRQQRDLHVKHFMEELDMFSKVNSEATHRFQRCKGNCVTSRSRKEIQAYRAEVSLPPRSHRHLHRYRLQGPHLKQSSRHLHKTSYSIGTSTFEWFVRTSTRYRCVSSLHDFFTPHAVSRARRSFTLGSASDRRRVGLQDPTRLQDRRRLEDPLGLQDLQNNELRDGCGLQLH